MQDEESENAQNGRSRWNSQHDRYTCLDGARAEVPRTAARRCERNGKPAPEYSEWEKEDTVVLRDGFSYRPRGENGCLLRLSVSGTKFDRKMSLVVKGAKEVKTATFPDTAREVQDGVFWGNWQLLSVILNEGLEKIGACQDKYESSCYGVFGHTGL